MLNAHNAIKGIKHKALAPLKTLNLFVLLSILSFENVSFAIDENGQIDPNNQIKPPYQINETKGIYVNNKLNSSYANFNFLPDFSNLTLKNDQNIQIDLSNDLSNKKVIIPILLNDKNNLNLENSSNINLIETKNLKIDLSKLDSKKDNINANLNQDIKLKNESKASQAQAIELEPTAIKFKNDEDLFTFSALQFNLENFKSLKLLSKSPGEIGTLEDGFKGNNEEIYSKSNTYLFRVNPFLHKFPMQVDLEFRDKNDNVSIHSLTINLKDELLPYEWHIYNNGVNYFGVKFDPVKRIDSKVYEAWQLKDLNNRPITGEGVVIGLIDADKIDFNHQDLIGQKFEILDMDNEISFGNINFDYSKDDLKEYDLENPNTHATGVAGIIAAKRGNGGVSGIAPKTKIFGFQSSTNRHHNPKIKEDDVEYDLYKSFDGLAKISEKYPQVRIINASVGNDIFLKVENDKAFQTLYENNVSVIHSAGNEYQNSLVIELENEDNITAEDLYPNNSLILCLEHNFDCLFTQTDMLSRFHGNIHVAAINSLGKRSVYSSTASNLWVSGFGGEYGYQIFEKGEEKNDSAALVTTQTSFTCSDNKDDQFNDEKSSPWRSIDPTCHYTSLMNGTSAAAPTVSAIVSFLYQVKSNITVPQVKYILAKTSNNDLVWKSLKYDEITLNDKEEFKEGKVILDYAWQNNQANMRFSNWYGFGVVNAKNAVELLLNLEKGNLKDDKYLKRANLPKNFRNQDQRNIICKELPKTLNHEYECIINGLNVNNQDEIEIEDVAIDIKGFSFTENDEERLNKKAKNQSSTNTTQNVSKENQESKDTKETYYDLQEQLNIVRAAWGEPLVKTKKKREFFHCNWNEFYRKNNLVDEDFDTAYEKYEKGIITPLYRLLETVYYPFTRTQIELISPNGTKSIIKPYGSYFEYSIEEEENLGKQRLNLITNAFYLEKVKTKSPWKINIKSACELDLNLLKQNLAIEVYGY